MDMGDFIPDAGGCMYLRNISNFLHIHAVAATKG
jgi:hypothetical protein